MLGRAFTDGFYFLDLAAHVTARNLGDGIPSTVIKGYSIAVLLAIFSLSVVVHSL